MEDLSELASDLFAVITTADKMSAVRAVGVDPGDAVDDYEHVYVIASRPASLNQTAILTGPSLFSIPCH